MQVRCSQWAFDYISPNYFILLSHSKPSLVFLCFSTASKQDANSIINQFSEYIMIYVVYVRSMPYFTWQRVIAQSSVCITVSLIEICFQSSRGGIFCKQFWASEYWANHSATGAMRPVILLLTLTLPTWMITVMDKSQPIKELMSTKWEVLITRFHPGL